MPALRVGEPAAWWKSPPAAFTNCGAAVWFVPEPGSVIVVPANWFSTA